MAITKETLFVLSLLLFVNCCFIRLSSANPEGAPPEACLTMDPSPGHEGSSPQASPCFYETVPQTTRIQKGGTVEILLRTTNSTSFKGYMTMAYDASNPDPNEPLGSFELPSDGQVLDCLDGKSNAISHTDNNSIKKNVTCVWKAPEDFVGSVVFMSTFVRGKSVYWVKVPSTVNVTVEDDAITTPSAVATTTKPIDSGATIGITTSNFVFSFIGFMLPVIIAAQM